MSAQHDLIVLGGGAAGTAAALAAGRLGLDVVLVEPGRRRKLREAEAALAELLAQRPLSGAPPERRRAGWTAAVRRAGEAAAAASDRRDRRLSSAGVARVAGAARLTGEPGGVRLGGATLHARHVLVATGSRPRLPEGCEAEPGALAERASLLDRVEAPREALVLGSGPEAAGLAGLLAAAGTRVRLAVDAPRLLPEADPDVSAAVARSLASAGAEVLTELACLGLEPGRVRLRGADGREAELESELTFAACGSRPAREACGLDEAAPGLPAALPEERFDAGPEGLWLAGSATGREMTPEAAEREGRAVVDHLLGRPRPVPRRCVPHLVAGLAGCGWVGLAEPEARSAGHALSVGRAQLPGSGRLRPGFVKILADSSSNRLLGVHAAGAQAREAVLLGAVAVEWGASRLDLAELAFPEDAAASGLLEAVRNAAPA